MDIDPLREALSVVIGVFTGVLSAAFGVGGAVVSTPSIRAIGVGASLAVGTTLPSILPSAVTGSWRYARENLVDWRAVRWTAPAGVVAAVGGSVLSKVVPGDGHLLMVATALLLAFTAWRMGRRPRTSTGPAEVAPPVDEPGRNDRPPVLVAIGAGAGLLSGLLGIGGGVVMVPGFTELGRLPLKTSIATSLACVGIFAIPGTITHAALDGILWPVAIGLAIGVVPGARLGAAAAIRASDDRLRLAVAAFLGVIAAVYFAGELLALLNDV